MSKLETAFYVVMEGYKRHRQWDLRAARIVKRIDRLPKLGVNEVPILVTVTLPKALFERPELTVKIDVDNDVPRIEVDAETMDNLNERLQEILGIPVTVTVDAPEPP